MVLAVEDQLAISQLITEFDQAIDSRNLEGILDTFATDGQILSPFGPPAMGEAELREFFINFFNGPFGDGSRGWEYLRLMGSRLLLPQPQHQKSATPTEQDEWKKNSLADSNN